MVPPCNIIPIQISHIANSDTPAWKNAPLKSPFLNSVVCLRNPSVLSELHKSADAQIMLGTCFANSARQAADAERVASFFFCSTFDQSIFGASPANQVSINCFFSGFFSAHSFSSSRRFATIVTRSFLRFSYNSFTSSKIVNGLFGSPSRFFIVLVKAPSPSGAPCVFMLCS